MLIWFVFLALSLALPLAAANLDVYPKDSLANAQKSARQLEAKGPVTIRLHTGVYTLTQPLELTPEDSNITWTAFENDHPIISGGRILHGWKPFVIDGKNLWAMDIPAVRQDHWYFHELWIDNHRCQRARGPNEGFYRIAALPDFDPKQPVQRGQRRFVYAAGNLQPFDNLDDVEIVALHFWTSTRANIASLDDAQHLVTLAQTSTMRLTDGFGKTPELARYYVENAFELLDSPGEWYLNRKTGTLYYMPRPGENIATAETVAPVLDHLLTITGDPRSNHLVEHVTFRGIAFSHVEWLLPNDGSRQRYQQQGSVDVPAAIRVYGAHDIAFERCTVIHAGTYGIHFSRGCQHDRIVGCDLSDLGGGGIKVGEPDREGIIQPDAQGIVHDQPSEETHDIEITDNDIHDNGKIHHQSLGVFVGQCYNIHISHNHIHDLYKNAVSVGWSWHFGKSLAHDNIIEWNDIHDIGKNWFNDGGGIYTLGIQPGTVIRYNLVHDIGSVVYGGRGIYLDQASSHILVENNITYNTTGGGLAVTYGQDNIIRNNIFAFGKTSQIEPNGGMATPERLANSFVFEHNIIYFTPDQKVLRNKWNDTPKVILRGNLYWQTGGGAFFMGPETWGDWQARGMDQGSILADPLFLDPAKRDFRLRPNSPALELGFKPFVLAAAGPRRR